MTLAEAVTVVEWGAGLAEGLADDRLEIDIVRTLGHLDSVEDTDVRQVVIRPIGKRRLDPAWPHLTCAGPRGLPTPPRPLPRPPSRPVCPTGPPPAAPPP